jgi:hypothetical protein
VKSGPRPRLGVGSAYVGLKARLQPCNKLKKKIIMNDEKGKGQLAIV